MARGGLVSVPTSKRPLIIKVQYPRIPSKIFKGMSREEVVDCIAVEVVVETVNNQGRGLK
jgi:hypothetical protein